MGLILTNPYLVLCLVCVIFTGIITVFINGVPTEVPRGPLDMKSAFGQDAILVHSSGLPVPTNEYGYLMQSLEHGESYFLVIQSCWQIYVRHVFIILCNESLC